MSESLGWEQLEGVARLFGVLAEPTRLAILQRLKAGPMPVKDLVAALGAKQANVSKQLGVLFDAGLLDRRREGGLVLYSIREPVIFELCQLVCDKLRRDAERRIEVLQRSPFTASAFPCAATAVAARVIASGSPR